jgi:N-acetylneuraminic acid mutarotase
MLSYNSYIFLFGGIQDVTKEKNDVYLYEAKENNWSKIHTTTNSIYDCSPTLKKSKKSVFLNLYSKFLLKSQS